MKNKVVKFNDKGYVKAKLVPQDVSENMYEAGLDLGPPDVLKTWLKQYMSTSQIKGLFEELFDHGFHEALNFKNRREELFKLLKTLGVDVKHIKAVMRLVVGAYQESEYD